jgi:hypothetical protein
MTKPILRLALEFLRTKDVSGNKSFQFFTKQKSKKNQQKKKVFLNNEQSLCPRCSNRSL